VLLAAAGRAPSGDNTQPWRFLAVREGAGWSVAVDVAAERDGSPMDAGGRMSRIACGAAVENLVWAAAAIGLDASVTTGAGSSAAIVRIQPGRGAPEPSRMEAIEQRVTNRRPYARAVVPQLALEELRSATPAGAGVATLWIFDAARIEQLADLVAGADRIMFGAAPIRRAIIGRIRFDAPANAPVESGLSLGSLEATSVDRLAMRSLFAAPDRIARPLGVARALAAKARRLVASSAGVCLVLAGDDEPTTDVSVGRAAERAWLALTGAGFTAQPMTSLAVLDSLLTHGSSILHKADLRRAGALRDDARRILRELGSKRIAFVMRVGMAPPPSGRTGRLPVGELR
jgi:hypothetical protein